MIMMSGDVIITEGEEVGVCGTCGGKEECIRVLVGKTLRRPRCGWDDNVQMYLQYIAWRGTDLIHMTQAHASGRLLCTW
jgi:hypothetical protein